MLLLNSGSTQITVTTAHPAGLHSAKSIFGSSFFSSGALPSGYSTAILWFIAVTIVATWVLSRTKFGNWIFAVGGEQNAARNTGVPVNRTKVLLFVATALAAALVGIISFTQASSAVSEQGVGYEFFYIIAAVVGGCLLTGGYGSAIGAALGACIIGMAFEGVIYAGWDSSWDFAFLGRGPVPGRGGQHRDLPTGTEGAAMSEGAPNMSEPTAGAADVEANARQGRTQANGAVPALEVRSVSKYFGSVNALEDISVSVYAGQVTCVLGDNGAGKSTLIKILSGVHTPDKGEVLFEGEPVTFAGPRDARARGIATVFQDLATVPLMSVWRNFFLGNEPTRGRGPIQRMDIKGAQRIMRDEMAKMGIEVRDPDQTVGTLSGGERQAMAIARAVYFGAKVLILDEPTSALGVRQSGIVLKYIIQAREMGRAVIFITHNPHHAYPVGDRFVLLKRGGMLGSYAKAETSIDGADLADGRRRRARGAQPRAPARGRPVDQGGRQGAGRRGSDAGVERDGERPRAAHGRPDQHRPVLRSGRRRLARCAELQQGGRRQPHQRGDRRRPPRPPRRGVHQGRIRSVR